MVRIICCHSFLGQNVFSPEHFTACFHFVNDELFIYCHEKQCMEVYKCREEEFQLVHTFPVKFPVVLVRFCPLNRIVFTLSRNSSEHLICLAYIYWERCESGIAPTVIDNDELSQSNRGEFKCVRFSDHRHASLIRLCPLTGRLAIVDGQSIIVYSFLNDAFDFVYRLDLELIPANLELLADFLIASSVNKVIVLEVFREKRNWIPVRADQCSEGGELLDIFHVDRLGLKYDGFGGLFQNKLDLQPKELLFPKSQTNSKVRSLKPDYSLVSWLMNVVEVHGDDKIHSIGVLKLEPSLYVAYFSTLKECHIYRIECGAKPSILKLSFIQYNSPVHSSVIGEDLLLHTLSQDTLQTYTTHIFSNLFGSDVDLPNLLIGSQMIFGVSAVARGPRSLMLSSVGENDDGSQSCTFYKLTMYQVELLFKDIIEKSSIFKNDSLPIYLHLKLEACYCLLSRNAEVSDWSYVLSVLADCIRAGPQCHEHVAVLLKAWNPSIDEVISLLHVSDLDSSISHEGILSYIGESLRLGNIPIEELTWNTARSIMLDKLLSHSQTTEELASKITKILTLIPEHLVKSVLVELREANLLDANHSRLLSFLFDCVTTPGLVLTTANFELSGDLMPYFDLLKHPRWNAFFQALLNVYPHQFRQALNYVSFTENQLFETLNPIFAIIYLDNVLVKPENQTAQAENFNLYLKYYISLCLRKDLAMPAAIFSLPVTEILQMNPATKDKEGLKFLISAYKMLTRLCREKSFCLDTLSRLFMIRVLYSSILNDEALVRIRNFIEELDMEVDGIFHCVRCVCEDVSGTSDLSLSETLVWKCLSHQNFPWTSSFYSMLPLFSLGLENWHNIANVLEQTWEKKAFLHAASLQLSIEEFTKLCSDSNEKMYFANCVRHHLGQQAYLANLTAFLS